MDEALTEGLQTFINRQVTNKYRSRSTGIPTHVVNVEKALNTINTQQETLVQAARFGQDLLVRVQDLEIQKKEIEEVASSRFTTTSTPAQREAERRWATAQCQVEKQATELQQVVEELNQATQNCTRLTDTVNNIQRQLEHQRKINADLEQENMELRSSLHMWDTYHTHLPSSPEFLSPQRNGSPRRLEVTGPRARLRYLNGSSQTDSCDNPLFSPTVASAQLVNPNVSHIMTNTDITLPLLAKYESEISDLTTRINSLDQQLEQQRSQHYEELQEMHQQCQQKEHSLHAKLEELEATNLAMSTSCMETDMDLLQLQREQEMCQLSSTVIDRVCPPLRTELAAVKTMATAQLHQLQTECCEFMDQLQNFVLANTNTQAHDSTQSSTPSHTSPPSPSSFPSTTHHCTLPNGDTSPTTGTSLDSKDAQIGTMPCSPECCAKATTNSKSTSPFTSTSTSTPAPAISTNEMGSNTHPPMALDVACNTPQISFSSTACNTDTLPTPDPQTPTSSATIRSLEFELEAVRCNLPTVPVRPKPPSMVPLLSLPTISTPTTDDTTSQDEEPMSARSTTSVGTDTSVSVFSNLMTPRTHKVVLAIGEGTTPESVDPTNLEEVERSLSSTKKLLSKRSAECYYLEGQVGLLEEHLSRQRAALMASSKQKSSLTPRSWSRFASGFKKKFPHSPHA